jgi:carbon starvation protein
MLAAIALCLATTIILKMQLHRGTGFQPVERIKQENEAQNTGQRPVPRTPWLALITLIPLIWLVAVTFTAGVEKIFHPDPRIGFLAQAKVINEKEPELQSVHTKANLSLMNFAAANYAKPHNTEYSDKLSTLQKASDDTWKAVTVNRTLRFNNLLDATVAGIFLTLVVAIILLSLREWFLLLSRRKPAVLHETEPVWLPDYAVAESRPLHIAGAAALALALAKEWSGESHLERAQQQAQAVCACGGHENPGTKSDAQLYVEVTEQRFNGVRRCC